MCQDSYIVILLYSESAKQKNAAQKGVKDVCWGGA